MKFSQLDSDRFETEEGLHVTVQVPERRVSQLMDAILTEDALSYGDYDRVAFKTAPGSQQFRSLGSGRNIATDREVSVPCIELSFFVNGDRARTVKILKAIYDVHPYEEPVIFLRPCVRSLHIRGQDEDNPNRFWNQAPENWVPDAHR